MSGGEIETDLAAIAEQRRLAALRRGYAPGSPLGTIVPNGDIDPIGEGKDPSLLSGAAVLPVPDRSGTIPDVDRPPNRTDPETLLPLPDAAQRLGIAYDTARKRLRAGTLRGEKHGGRWLVWVPESENGPESTARRPEPDPESVPDARPESVRNVPDALITELRSEVAFLRQQVERQNHLLAGLIQRLPELPTGEDAPTRAPEAPGATERAGPSPDPSASWWRRWWRRVSEGP